MNEPPVMPSLYCSRCGATNPPYAAQCWLCTNKASNTSPVVLVPITDNANDPVYQRSQRRTQQVCAVLLAGCILLTVLIGIGFGMQDPGMLIPYAIVVGPAYLATGVRALHGYAVDGKPTATKLLTTFFLSGVFTIGFLMVLAVASFLAFFVWCISQL